MRKILILPDVHLTDKAPKPYQVVKKFASQFKPDEIVILGDFMDVSSLSGWELDKRRPMEGKRYMKEVDRANKELDDLSKLTKKITYLEGNHEDRVERYLDANPEMEGMLDIPKVLRLTSRGIKWYKYNSLYRMGHLYFTHGCYANKYVARTHLDNFGCNLVVGHIHRPDFAFKTAKMQKEMACWSLGCLCGKSPDYQKGRPNSWGNGFGIAYVDDKTGKFTMYSINIIDDKFIWNGVTYQ